MILFIRATSPDELGAVEKNIVVVITILIAVVVVVVYIQCLWTRYFTTLV
jgi:hypothetical protein